MELDVDSPAYQRIHRLTTILPEQMNQAQVPGLSLALIQNAQLVWAKSFGVTSQSTLAPVTTETVFEACSISKPVSAYVILICCEQDLLDLDTPLRTYLPESYNSHTPEIDNITPRHVLTHTAGFPNWLSRLVERQETGSFAYGDAEPVLHFSPGQKFSYSGEGFYYLQRVLEVITGLSFAGNTHAKWSQ
jgi:CubicO group peptidase (beta-lactamase class C family)